MFGHAVLTIGFLLALPTGMWQYLGGILDVELPIPIYLFYRVHYIGAAIVLFALAAFLSYLWMTGDGRCSSREGSGAGICSGSRTSFRRGSARRTRSSCASTCGSHALRPGSSRSTRRSSSSPAGRSSSRSSPSPGHQGGPLPRSDPGSCSLSRFDLPCGGYGGDRDQAARSPSLHVPPMASGELHRHDLGQRTLRPPEAPRWLQAAPGGSERPPGTAANGAGPRRPAWSSSDT